MRKARITADSPIAKLDAVYDGALAGEQYSAAGRAVEVQGKSRASWLIGKKSARLAILPR